MAKKVYEEEKIRAIADTIREKTGGSTTYTTEDMPSGVAEVYNAGKQAEYDAFWDAYQRNGQRTNYSGAFSGDGWNVDTFKPKYLPIVITENNAARMFEHFSYYGKGIAAITPDIVDFSRATHADYSFLNAEIESIQIDLGSCTSLVQTFSFPAGNVVKSISVRLAPTSVNAPFYRCVFLENLSFWEGSVIKCKGFDFQFSTKLTKESLTNIINVLSDETSGLTVTLSKTAVNKAFETGEGYADGSDSAAWSALVATKSNWTISLV